MDTNEYLLNRLQTCSFYKLTIEDKDLLAKLCIEKKKKKKLTLGKFRKWSIDINSQERVKNAIKLNILRNQPIQFAFPFGGYKLWRFPTSPEVDWAEFFTIAYYLNYVSPIPQVYKPGMIFYFSSDDIIIERMDNVPTKDTDTYFASFNILLSEFRKYFPPNLKMEIKRVADFYPKEEFENELALLIEKIKQEQPSWEEKKKNSMLKTSELNIKWDGVQDWTKLSEKVKQAKIEMGPTYHDAYCALSRRRAFVRGEDKIVVFTTPIPNAIAIGTSKTSVTKFWTGFGVLEKEKGQFFDRILSFEQWKKVKDQPHEVMKTGLVPLKNFQEIWVYPQRFNFGNKI
ncbi:hypothetical protein HZB97_00910 [Candidatus Gottesmanbacteria bacterium]|nr:hypothetical protein [Candidatus Gottesmanbacteria bacterium]